MTFYLRMNTPTPLKIKNMSKSLPLIIFTILFSFIGCKEVDELTQFSLDYNSEITIPSSTIIDLPVDILTPDVETNSSSKFENNNTNADLVESVYLTEMDLTITSPSNTDFSFLESIEVYIVAEGLEDVKIAWEDNVPKNTGDKLVLTTTEKDLKEFVKKDVFNLRVKTVTDEAITKEHTINAYTVFFVDAKVLGI